MQTAKRRAHISAVWKPGTTGQVDLRQKTGGGREYGLGWCGGRRDWMDARDWRDFRDNGSIGRRKKRQGTELSVSPVHPVSPVPPVPPVPSVIGHPGPRPEKKRAIPNPCRRTLVPSAADGSVGDGKNGHDAIQDGRHD